jgi:hypothetical protein
MASLSPLDGHQPFVLSEQAHSILSQYQVSYQTILDIATYLSLNKLLDLYASKCHMFDQDD